MKSRYKGEFFKILFLKPKLGIRQDDTKVAGTTQTFFVRTISIYA